MFFLCPVYVDDNCCITTLYIHCFELDTRDKKIASYLGLYVKDYLFY